MNNKEDFATLPLSKEMLQNLKNINYLKMTPIQAQSLPCILDGKDVLAQAKTGSGKTAAFGIGLLSKLDVTKFDIQSLILCPTRELAEQVALELRKLAKFQHNIKIITLCGGVAFGPQLNSLRHKAHIVIGTPGRIMAHLNKGSLKLDNIKTLVLDEADRMLDMGFMEDVEKILSYVPNEHQTLLFSATFPDEIIDLSRTLQKNAINIKTIDTEEMNSVKEYFYQIHSYDKFKTLVDVFSTYKPKNTIVFCNTKVQTKELAVDLRDANIDALAIHGDLEQYERNDVLTQFKNESCPILIATDVAARGLDIKELDMVVNYDFPFTKEVYAHRIGRTARAGKEGIAVSFIDENDKDIDLVFEYSDIENLKSDKIFSLQPKNVTLVIEGGKKDKLRAGDILGSLTKEGQIPNSMIGKIDIMPRQSYVALHRDFIRQAFRYLKNGKIKGKKFSVWVLE